ncbi:MAG: choice-of-anchor D domain-containing protein, partial [Marinicellaceae bacterium]
TNGAGKGLGGGIFVLHSTTNSNGNNQGMPTQLATVTACELSFSNNTAADDPNSIQNNDDVFDLSSLMNASNGMPLSTQCSNEIEIRGNTQEINDNDASPRIEDHTDFGLVHNDESITRTFTVHNVGSANLNLTGSPIVEINGVDAADFSVSSQPNNSIASGASTSFGITFNPVSIGIKQAIISIANDDSDENPYNFNIKGLKVAPEIDVSFNGLTIEDGDTTPEFTDGTYLGAVAVVSGPISKSYEISNLGNADLILTGSPKIEIIGSHASEFNVIQMPNDSLILPNQSLTFAIEFDAASAGIKDATVLIVSNDTDESLYNFDISGLGLAPEIDISGNGFEITNGDNTPSTGDNTNFGSTQVTGGNVKHQFDIFNNGNINLSLETFPYVSISGADASSFLISNIPQTDIIEPNESEPFSIVFDPSSSGVKSAVVTVTSNDVDESEYTFNIQGLGQPTITLSSVNAEVNEGDVVMFDAQLDVSTDSDTLVNFVITGEVDSNDFESQLSGQVNIESGQTIAEINLLSIEDNINEGLEIFDITISQSNPDIVSENITLMGSIDDDIIFTNGFENK